MNRHFLISSKLSVFIFAFCFIFLFAFPTHAACNIKPLAEQYITDLYAYSTFGLEKPNITIERGKPPKMSQSDITQYGISKKSSKKYYIGAYTQGDTIGIYQKIFSSYEKCDKAAKSKLRAMITHEYTHYVDGSSYGLTRLSMLIGTSNYEKTAIVGENTLAKVVWNKSIIPTRKLTSQEKRTDAATLRNYFVSRRGD